MTLGFAQLKFAYLLKIKLNKHTLSLILLTLSGNAIDSDSAVAIVHLMGPRGHFVNMEIGLLLLFLWNLVN